MLRLSTYMRLLAADPPAIRPAALAAGGGPVVIWNLIRRCNLRCRHCYSLSSDHDFSGELSTAEAFAVLDDLAAYKVPALILSGGEPLLRPDLFEIAAEARRYDFYLGLSTNGTLVDEAAADRIAAAGFDYVGISLDGLSEAHDRFRRLDGAFEGALNGIRHCRARGIKVGLRFTLTRANASDLPEVLDLADSEGIEKIYLSHLNYAGRGGRNHEEDAWHALTRRAMDLVLHRAEADALAGRQRDWVTGNNDADAVYLLHWAAARHPGRVEALRKRLVAWGGNASGVAIANIDNRGVVHPDTMWWEHGLGNVRERPFSRIWSEADDSLMSGLRQRPRPVGGRCAGCAHLDICNGNTRTRAFRLTGDPWAEDPGCYLTDHEIGLAGPGRAVGGEP
ncbi:MAG: heme d1 biosynthesis radical SAM protein NirJ [Alphaproteobacteria bacterium]|nr:heme d1 biosynthesis radical SAM protein NirJ [Alphaproteobacteria bacterium]